MPQMPQNLATEPLKAERIQEKLKAERIQQPLKAERIQERLAEHPGWALTGVGDALVRTYELPTPRAAGCLVELALAIGEHAGHAPEIDIRDRTVTLRITTEPHTGVVDGDFDWIAALEGRG